MQMLELKNIQTQTHRDRICRMRVKQDGRTSSTGADVFATYSAFGSTSALTHFSLILCVNGKQVLASLLLNVPE